MKTKVYKYDGTVYEIEAPELIISEEAPTKNEEDVWAELDRAYTEGVNTAYDQ